MLSSGWKAGMDGKWEVPEIEGWRSSATRLASAIRDLQPDRYEVMPVGKFNLASITSKKGEAKRFVLIHPFWAVDAVQRLLADSYAGKTYFIDTFDASRRPLRALDMAQGAQ